MKSWKILCGILLIFTACETDSFISGLANQSLNNTEDTVTAETWKQVAVRFPATSEIISIPPQNAIEIRITGEDIQFVSDNGNCPGRISNDGISMGDCYYQSPYWIIAERTSDTLYIYPRIGAMYYSDYVLVKAEDSRDERCNLTPQAGLCEAAIPRFYFDKAEGKCKQFLWGGCDGVIPFETMVECESCKCNQMQ